jgi:uncharacterized membrane protein YkoI
MNSRRRYLIAGAAVVAIAVGGAGVAAATGGIGGDDDGDATVSGPAADEATAAALAITGGGTANAVERDTENGATWEVEVTKPDGNTVDVRLDESYNLVVVEGDSGESEPGEDGD